MSKPLWKPTRKDVEKTHLNCFIAFVNRKHGLDIRNYDQLYNWSVSRPGDFWTDVWVFSGIEASHPWEAALENPVMPGARWFHGAQLNFAENLLRFRDEHIALIAVREGGRVDGKITYAELYRRVARMASFLHKAGVRQCDRVAGFVPNCPEAVIAMLATASLGAIWTSCSPDFGFRSVMDRLGQIEPTILITADGYTYNGKPIDCLERAAGIEKITPSIEKVVVVPYLDRSPDLSTFGNALLWEEALDGEADEIDFVQLPFEHPLYIMYSSGTTGAPKCMVHGAGGTLIQHAKELLLHTDLKREDTITYFTTCGWMMWNWLVSSLFVGSTVVLYEGSAAFPDTGVLWKMAQELDISVFGTSAKFLDLCRRSGLRPGTEYDLGALRAILSTGSPLTAENFEWVYREVKKKVQLASISGGTDLISCFMLGSPIDPVYPGEIQKRGLGMKVEAWDEEGRSVIGEKGELVCTAPFPSMPISFWGDNDGKKYREAYFADYPGVWRHGDYIEITPRGGVIVYGRSDATLNPGGVRIGTAEIYRPLEELAEIEDALVVGQRQDEDERVVLFVVTAEGVDLDDRIRDLIRETVREKASPRHVPEKIIAVPQIPYTINGKKVEIAVSRILHGENPGNRDALANPEALEYFQDLEELKS